ncbi:MAG: class I poly(R)-hydroxyalkanoic acid synthase, partial [Burkholderiales bacterium]|nr:class I poly(R)-hydroxyalkanoic acid synthase [Burkholderiales bacterium]
MTAEQDRNIMQLDPAEMSKSFADIAQRSSKLVAEFMQRQPTGGGKLGMADETGIAQAFFDLTTKVMSDPFRLAEVQMRMWQDYMSLWQGSMMSMFGQKSNPVIAPATGDKRFKHDDWQENFVFDYIKQSYLIAAHHMNSLVADVKGLDEQTAKKVNFFTRQYIDALSPSNFAMTNPEVVRATVESGGQNLVRGLSNLLGDLERGDGQLRISMTDTEAFELGKNIAASKGKVVYQNDLMQLLQYEPGTKEVYKKPLLIMPPWINKFYILDLRDKNSLIKWAIDQGHTVFVISWVNPDSKLRDKNFENYMLEGPLEALDAIEKATGEREVNAVGYCLGGTLLASTMAYMQADDDKTNDKRIASATLLTTLIDFEEPGELGVFLNEQNVEALEKRMAERGYLEGSEMATTFNLLRANDLIWSFVINNYLLGKEAFPFDLLFWNSDSTRMPARMHSFYLRKMYLENALKEPNGISLNGVGIDMGKV